MIRMTDIWEKLDEWKEGISGGVQDEVNKMPLDKAQALIIMLVGAAITESSIGYFPIMTLSFHIGSMLNLGIGLCLFIFAFIWWGLHY